MWLLTALATPTPHNDLACGILPDGTHYPTGSNCTPIAGTVGGSYSGTDTNPATASHFLLGGKIFGYRQIDFAINKDFDLTHGMSAYIRADFLNVFNYHNYSDYFTYYGAGGSGVYAPNPVAYQKFGNISSTRRNARSAASS